MLSSRPRRYGQFYLGFTNMHEQWTPNACIGAKMAYRYMKRCNTALSKEVIVERSSKATQMQMTCTKGYTTYSNKTEKILHTDTLTIKLNVKLLMLHKCCKFLWDWARIEPWPVGWWCCSTFVAARWGSRGEESTSPTLWLSRNPPGYSD